MVLGKAGVALPLGPIVALLGACKSPRYVRWPAVDNRHNQEGRMLEVLETWRAPTAKT